MKDGANDRSVGPSRRLHHEDPDAGHPAQPLRIAFQKLQQGVPPEGRLPWHLVPCPSRVRSLCRHVDVPSQVEFLTRFQGIRDLASRADALCVSLLKKGDPAEVGVCPVEAPCS